MRLKMVRAPAGGKGSTKSATKASAAPPPPKPKASKLKGGVTIGVFAAVQAAVLAVASGKAGDAALAKAAKGFGLSPRERRRAFDLSDQVFRHWARLGWLMEQAKGGAGGREKLLLALKLFLQTPTSQLAALLRDRNEIEPLYPVEANALDRVAINALDTAPVPNLAKLECPPEFESPLRRALTNRFESNLRAMLKLPPTTLRINTLKRERGETLERLRGFGWTIDPGHYAPDAIQVPRDTEVGVSTALIDGSIEVQDEASQLAAILVDARPGQQVLDLCAGAGGKSLALAAAMQNKGHLIAADTHSGRLQRAKQRLKRANVENAECVLLDAKWLKAKRGRFDRVLVDAPCTGTGAWGRNPDQRWTIDAADMVRLNEQQDRLLDQGAAMVKTGGRLIYATCSLLIEENQDRVAAFADRHQDFKAIAAQSVWQHLGLPEWPCNSPDYLQLTPDAHSTDGFFVAIFERQPLADGRV